MLQFAQSSTVFGIQSTPTRRGEEEYPRQAILNRNRDVSVLTGRTVRQLSFERSYGLLIGASELRGSNPKLRRPHVTSAYV